MAGGWRVPPRQQSDRPAILASRCEAPAELRNAKLGWRFANVPEVIGEHYVHPGSWFNSSFKYAKRQRDLAKVQAQIVKELGLPSWMYVFAVGRYTYAYLPSGLKRAVRRGIAGSREQDV